MAAKRAVKIPDVVYGTAWKKDATRSLVKQALHAGFRGIDTAAQPRHYQEDAVGQGIRDAISDGIIKREDLYIQTKYTSPHGQDPKCTPYNTSKSITCQVGDSLSSSLKNLRHFETGPQTGAQQPYIDCLILHSPFPDPKDTQEAWRAMELHVPTFTRTLGLSNVYDAELLDKLWNFASTKPAVLQNRFYPGTGYDADVRAYCAEYGIAYQSFWTLTANPGLLRSDVVASLTAKVGVSEAVALYALALGLGKVSVLNGTTNVERMREDIMGLKKVATWADKEPEAWQEVMDKFQELIAS